MTVKLLSPPIGQALCGRHNPVKCIFYSSNLLMIKSETHIMMILDFLHWSDPDVMIPTSDTKRHVYSYHHVQQSAGLKSIHSLIKEPGLSVKCKQFVAVSPLLSMRLFFRKWETQKLNSQINCIYWHWITGWAPGDAQRSVIHRCNFIASLHHGTLIKLRITVMSNYPSVIQNLFWMQTKSHRTYTSDWA